LPNYFDVLSETKEETPLRVTESEFPGMQQAMAQSLDPKGKVPMSLWDLEAEASEKETQLALHSSREKMKRNNGGKEGSRNCRVMEAAGRPSS
jgi:hypothetical protein